jgi:hypothetical protein
VFKVELDDLLTLPVFQPEISGNWGIVIVGFTVALEPVVKLALGDR